MGSPLHLCSTCPRRLSKKVRRHIVVTVTLVGSPSMIVTSRPAATLSTAARLRILRLVQGLMDGRDKVLLVARSVNIIHRVTAHMVMVCTNQVVRRTAGRSLFTGPLRPCAETLLTSVPALGAQKEHLPIVRNAIPSLQRSSIVRNYHFGPEYLSERRYTNFSRCTIIGSGSKSRFYQYGFAAERSY